MTCNACGCETLTSVYEIQRVPIQWSRKVEKSQVWRRQHASNERRRLNPRSVLKVISVVVWESGHIHAYIRATGLAISPTLTLLNLRVHQDNISGNAATLGVFAAHDMAADELAGLGGRFARGIRGDEFELFSYSVSG